MFRYMLLTSAAAVALCSMPALAQSNTADIKAAAPEDDASIENQAPVAQDRAVANAEGRSPGVEATQNIDQPVDAADIVVTGYRASLGTAQ